MLPPIGLIKVDDVGGGRDWIREIRRIRRDDRPQLDSYQYPAVFWMVPVKGRTTPWSAGFRSAQSRSNMLLRKSETEFAPNAVVQMGWHLVTEPCAGKFTR